MGANESRKLKSLCKGAALPLRQPPGQNHLTKALPVGNDGQGGSLFRNQSPVTEQTHFLSPPFNGVSQKRAGPNRRLLQIFYRHQPRRREVVARLHEPALEILRDDDSN